MLFSPDYHEQLTDRGWDEAWVQARIDRVVADAIGAVDDRGLWPEHPDDHDDDFQMPKSVYMGAAGMLWGLHALGHDRPDLIRGLYQSYLREPDWPGLEPSYLGGEAGILLVSQLLDPSGGDLDALEDAIRRNAGHPSNELLWGGPGTMVAAQAMHAASSERRWADA
ncbi:MAG: hypothetical protein QOI17_1406, partial [Gaiellales bacterium]|nr:hypothetical protein [Gaiellales bacterium]